jgi:hypothetical protein
MTSSDSTVHVPWPVAKQLMPENFGVIQSLVLMMAPPP